MRWKDCTPKGQKACGLLERGRIHVTTSGTAFRRRLYASVSVLLGLVGTPPAHAYWAVAPATGKAPPPPEASPDDEPDIVVRGQRLPGAVVGDIPAELQYGPADIRAYGVSSVADLLSELGPEIRSDRGRGGEAPAVLLNGRRISSFSEIRDIPTEAILRVDILPEEVALKYGYSADQRVVNIVLRRRFRAITSEGGGSTTTEGGAENGTADLDLLHIRGDNRINLDIKYQDTASLLESDRGLMSAATGRPYDLTGNITGIGGAEIDPALSAAAGRPVTIAGVPASAANDSPGLTDFVGTAGTPNVTDVSPYRTLAPSKRDFTVNSVLAHPLTQKISATVNGTFDLTDSDSLRGLPGSQFLVPSTDPFSPFGQPIALYRYLDTDPLKQSVRTLTGHLGFGLNGDFAKWRLSFTGNIDHGDTRTVTQTGVDISAAQAALNAGDASFNPFGTIPASLLGAMQTARARAISNTGNIQFVANGPVLKLPAGPVSSSIKVGWSDNGFDSSSVRGGIEQRASLSRRDASGQLNLDLPLTSRKNHILGAIGDLSANFNVAADQLSDFGTLTTYGYGANWSPRDGINLIASTTHDEGAPTVQQLGNPVIVTPEVRVFDYRTGQTVDVSQTAGGNPALQADHRHVDKIGLTLKPIHGTDLTITANYIHSSIRNAIAGFPSPTAAIETAFPDRFTRDTDGNLERIDIRPINFAREERQELRWGINFTQKLKSSQKLIDAYRALRAAGGLPRFPGGGGSGAGGDGNRGAGGGGGFAGRGSGGFGGRSGGGQGGRLQISFYHTWYFRDDILIKQGGPRLDLLDGGTTGSGGGQPRHELELQVGLTNNGIGARFTGQWQSATTVTGGVGSATGNLRFSPLATANFRLFADLGQQPSLVKHRWARGMRVTLSVTNIFDSRQHVHDATGATPLSYQPAYLDPLGRTVKISLRKLFF